MAQLVETSWRFRRWASLGSLAWAAALFSYIVVFGDGSAVQRDALGILGMLILGVLGTYSGLATWDDRNRMVHGRIDPTPPPLPPGAPDERG